MRSALGIVLLLLVIALVIAGLTYANLRFSNLYPGGNDFLARWNGARYWLVQGISPYDQRVSRDTQLKIYGHVADPSKGEDKNHFVYPLPSMLFFGLFGLMDYPLARALWMTAIELSLIGLAIVGMRLADWKVPLWKATILILFSILWYHALRTIVIGQFAAINALLIALSLLLIKKKQDFIAGMVLSLSIAKPQMSFLIIPYVLFWSFSMRRWELWWGGDIWVSDPIRCIVGSHARLACPNAQAGSGLSQLHLYWLTTGNHSKLNARLKPASQHLFTRDFLGVSNH